jgi:L-lactate dehydrogenase complex protein LldG
MGKGGKVDKSVGELLSRVRAALAEGGPTDEETARVQFREVLPAATGGPAELEAQFARNAEELKAEFRSFGSADALAAHLKEIAGREGWKRMAGHRGGVAEAAVAALGLPVLWTGGGYDKRELEKCDASVTGCDALVAQTGGVLVTARSAGGRALSVLPHHHVVVAQKAQLLADLPAAFELLEREYGKNYPSFISFITGPSRTADIEQTLVLGAHGPRKLTILMA